MMDESLVVFLVLLNIEAFRTLSFHFSSTIIYVEMYNKS